eukprot:7278570-Prymnesium_polylepis.1
MVKRLRQKASAHLNSVSVPLTLRASPIADAPWTPILFSMSQSEVSAPLNFKASQIAVAP